VNVLDEQFVRACARMEPSTRDAVVEALVAMRDKLLEDIVAADFNLVEGGRGSARMVGQIIHLMRSAPELVQQIDEKRRSAPKLVP
jgi:hypothetical protein